MVSQLTQSALIDEYRIVVLLCHEPVACRRNPT